MTKEDRNIIEELKTILMKNFSEHIVQIIFYGSRVNQPRTDSDFDILIITKEKIDRSIEKMFFDVIFFYSLENDILIDTKYLSDEEYNVIHRNMPYVREVRATGITV